MKKIKLINLLDGMFMVNKHTTKPIIKDVKNWKKKNKSSAFLRSYARDECTRSLKREVMNL